MMITCSTTSSRADLSSTKTGHKANNVNKVAFRGRDSALMKAGQKMSPELATEGRQIIYECTKKGIEAGAAAGEFIPAIGKPIGALAGGIVGLTGGFFAAFINVFSKG